jgi:hypothetical protein
MIGFPGHHEKDRIATPVGIHLPLTDQWLQESCRQTTSLGEIATHAIQSGEIR